MFGNTLQKSIQLLNTDYWTRLYNIYVFVFLQCLIMASADVVQDQQVRGMRSVSETSLFFCRGCGVSLCDHCVSIHLRVKSKNVHVIVDYASKDDDDTGFCESHPQNQCSTYCKNCDVPICILLHFYQTQIAWNIWAVR